jgi:hypothetical protein
MIDHERALQLAAAELDFTLSPADAEALTAHLQSCEPCRVVSVGLRADAVALGELEHEDAPEDLRSRILDTILPAGADAAAPTPAPTGLRPILLRLPPRYRNPAVLMAAAAVIVAVVGGTLAWRSVPSDGGIAVIDPSRPPFGSDAPGGSGGPGGGPGPEPTNPPGSVDPGLVTAWAPVAELAAQKITGGVVDLDSGFILAALGSTPAAELVRHITVQPALQLTASTQADGRVRLTPAEPLSPGTVYRFTLAGDAGQTLDTWAFQARQPLRVISTLPENTETGVRRNTGIEVTFDQDGVVDAAAHMTIEPRVDGRFEQHDRVLAFIPDRLAPATVYTVTITRGVAVGATGEQLESDFRFQFETEAEGAPATDTTFRFANDLFESATADRPTIALWYFGEVSDEPDGPKAPDTVPLEVYRFPDQTAAIDAFQHLRAVPSWSQWNANQPVPTSGLTLVAGLDAHLENAAGTLWTRLPEPLPAGWYLVRYPSATHPAEAVLQVTDVAGYLMVSDTQTLVWANDLATGEPIAGAAVAADGASVGSTKADGTMIVDTPPTLLPGSESTCVDGCEPVVTVSSGGRSAFLPATGANGEDEGKWWVSSGDGHPQYWRVFNTDRIRYRRTDTINTWGMLRDRERGTVPESVTLRLTVATGDVSETNPPVAQLDARTRPTGAFTGSLELDEVPEGLYQLQLLAGGEVLSSKYLEVGRILKPAYRLDVVTGRRVYIAGDRIKVTATASFYDGTPVPGVPLRMDGFIASTPTTDATGSAIVRGTARIDDEADQEGPSYQTVAVRPGRAEEGGIEGASREFIVFPSRWTVGAESEIRDGRVRLTGGLNVVDRDRLEQEIADGTPVWDLDPRGAPVKGRTVTAIFTELIPVRTQTGTTYDFVEKRVVPVYEYDQREEPAGTLRLTTDARGRFSGSVPAPDEGHDYSIRISITDPDGHKARASTFASQGASLYQERQSASYLALTADPASGSGGEFGVGEEIDLTVLEADDPASAKDDRHLFYVAQQGLRDVAIRPSSRFVTTFPAWGPPNIAIGSIRFTGAGYETGQSFHARFRASDREITVDLQPDKARYAPGDKVTIGVRTRDHAGRALPATVVLSIVDEKLFSIGAAAVDDPLKELYGAIDIGIRATYATHRPPRAQNSGGDTGGGGDDEPRDSVLFKAVDTGANGRGSVTFSLSADLTSWHVSASAIGAGLEAGTGTTQIPVGLPFFVDAAIAPQYLLADRPSIQIRGFGSSLDPTARVTFTVDSDSLGLRESGLRADAFKAITVPLPKLKLGIHSITITGRTGSGDSARTHRVTRSFEVVASRLTRTSTSYQELSGKTAVQGGAGLTEIIVSDASAGRELPLLLELRSGGSARLERALAADVATSLIAARFGGEPIDPSASAFDGTPYQREDGGVAILPYASSDLEVSALAALVAPDRFNGQALKSYFGNIASNAKETRERRNFALAGLAGLGAPVLEEIRAAAADTQLTVRERLMLGLGAAASGDASTARSVAVAMAQGYGEAVGDQARLRAGDDGADVTSATSLMAMLMAAVGDPVAPRYRAYVEANPDLEATYALQQVGYVARVLAHLAPQPGSFAYEAGGKRRVVDLRSGESFHLTLTKGQLASFSIEPVSGATGLTTTWQEPVKASAFEKDPDVKIERTVKPSGTVNAADLVVVDLKVTFGSKAAAGCHRVTELVPSGLIPVGVMRGGAVDQETGEPIADVQYPDEQAGQRVVFCAEPSSTSRTVRLRYVARVITVGTYAWEPTIVESRSGPDRAAIVPAREITIR